MDRLRHRPRRPRALAALTVAGALCLALAACSPTPASSASSGSASSGSTSGSLTVFISGDTNVQDLWVKGIIPAFTKQHPGVTITTTLDLHGQHDQQSLAKLTAAVKGKQDPGYDLVDAGFVTAAAQAGLLAPDPASAIPNIATVPKATVKAGGTGGIPYRASSVLLAYDTTKVSSPPTTLDGLLTWITSHPGQFTYNTPSTGGSGGSFVTTVLDKYLSAADRSKMEAGYVPTLESAWDPGFAELKSLTPAVYQHGVYPNGNDQVLQLLGQGAISMAPVWSDQVITAQNTGTLPSTVAYTQISDPSFNGSASYLGIPKSGAHVKLAQQLANFVLSPSAQSIIATQIAGYPVVGLDTLPASVKEKFTAADPSTLRPGYSSQMTDDMNNLWDQKVPGT